MKKFEAINEAGIHWLVKHTHRNVYAVVIHCSATPEGRNVTAQGIENMHLQKGWSEIGYNAVIELDGTLRKGRNWNRIPAHVRGHNRNTIGICYIGGVDANMKAKDTRTPEQIETLEWLLPALKTEFCKEDGIDVVIQGHRDYSPDLDGDGIIEEFEWVKHCPCFEVKDLLEELNLI